MSKQRYDIFISYRRSASEFAQLVASHLKSAGYRVFIDVESLRSGKFNTQLFEVIDSCKDFVIVLPEGGLDRCSSNDDWVRMEYERAEKSGKNIVPVLLSGFSWPSPMPEGMEELKDYQGLSATSAEYYDLSIKRLRSYLKSRPHRGAVAILKWLAGIVATLVLLLLLAEGILSLASRTLYTRVADKLTNQVCVLDLLGDSNETIDAAWEQFLRDFDAPEKKNFRKEILLSLDESLDNVLRGLAPIRKQLEPSRIDLTPWESLLVSLKEISSEELALSNTITETFIDDIENRVSLIKEAVADGEVDLIGRDLVKEDSKIFLHLSNAHYYSYLSIISLLPENSRTRYNDMVSLWHHFPNGVGLGHSQKEYEQFVNKEYSELQRYNYDLSKRLLKVEQKYEETLMLYNDRASQYVNLYRSTLSQARDSLGVDAFRDWVRIVMVSSFLPDLLERENEPEDLPFPIKAAGVADDLSSLLSSYGETYPMNKFAAETAATFYSIVSARILPYKGLIVTLSIGQEGVSEGDIVTSINGLDCTSKNLGALDKILAGGKMRTLKVRTIKGGKAEGERTVDIDPEKGPVSFLPLVPWGE